jgi:hypothetical protein
MFSVHLKFSLLKHTTSLSRDDCMPYKRAESYAHGCIATGTSDPDEQVNALEGNEMHLGQV